MPARRDSKYPKVRALVEEGTLNPAPEKVHDPKFRDSDFFDPHDIVQVKYELLRRVSVESASVGKNSDTRAGLDQLAACCPWQLEQPRMEYDNNQQGVYCRDGWR